MCSSVRNVSTDGSSDPEEHHERSKPVKSRPCCTHAEEPVASTAGFQAEKSAHDTRSQPRLRPCHSVTTSTCFICSREDELLTRGRPAADHHRETPSRSLQAPERSGSARVAVKPWVFGEAQTAKRGPPVQTSVCSGESAPSTNANTSADGGFKIRKLLQRIPASSKEQSGQIFTSFYIPALTVNPSPSSFSHSYTQRVAFCT